MSFRIAEIVKVELGLREFPVAQRKSLRQLYSLEDCGGLSDTELAIVRRLDTAIVRRTAKLSPKYVQRCIKQAILALELLDSGKISKRTCSKYLDNVGRLSTAALVVALGVSTSNCSGSQKGQLTFDYTGDAHKTPSLEPTNPSLNNLDK